MQMMEKILETLRLIIGSVVIKYDRLAKPGDAEVETQRDIHKFMSASTGRDSFNTYASFSIAAIAAAGVTNPTLQQQYHDDKYNIPLNLRDAIVLKQRELTIAGYVEKNNYYRKYMGIPDYDDTEFIYIDPETADELGVPDDVPVHQLPFSDIYILESSGVMKQILEMYPTKTYLTFLGSKRIDLITARSAPNYGIMYVTKEIPDAFYDEFMSVYDQCRDYFISVIFNKEMSKRYEYYDNFIALGIMTMTIQRVITNTFKYGIQYDFYDVASIKMVFDAYQIPFISNLPLDYQRIIVRNLNSLLRYRSTDKVLYDILSLLGLDRVKIYKYFLFKEHRMDSDGNPLFLTKEIPDPEDPEQTIEVPNMEGMYEIFFQAVELKEKNVALALADNINIMNYAQVTGEDPYWWDEDEELMKEIYEGEFNFIETKYLGMNIMYKLTEMLFEISYFFNMLIDKKANTSFITIPLPRISEEGEFDFFTIAIILSALVARKNKFAGEIIHTPTKTMHINGFNFANNFQIIRQNILNNPLLDDAMVTFFTDMNPLTADRVNNLYRNIRDLNDFLIERMGQAKDIATYRAYKELYDTLMTTQHMESLFRKSDNTIANTFIEYLEDRNPLAADAVKDVPYENIGELVEHILFRLNSVVGELKHLHIVNDSDGSMVEAATILIRFFKSYTTDIASYNILYIMDSQLFNLIKYIDHVHSISKTVEYGDTIGNRTSGIKDLIKNIYKVNSIADQVPITDSANYTANLPINTNANITDKILSSSANLTIQTDAVINDRIFMLANMMLGSQLHLADNLSIRKTMQLKTNVSSMDKIKSIQSILHTATNADIIDVVERIIKILNIQSSADVSDSLAIVEASMVLGDNAEIIDIVRTITNMTIATQFPVFKDAIVFGNSTLKLPNEIAFIKDSLTIIR